MAEVTEMDPFDKNDAGSDLNVTSGKSVVDVHPLAFTIEFNDQKVDEAKKNRVHERLSAVNLKHRRNPSLPDFRTLRNEKNDSPSERLTNRPHPQLNSNNNSFSKTQSNDNQRKSIDPRLVKKDAFKSPALLKKYLNNNNGASNLFENIRKSRRSSIGDVDNNGLAQEKTTACSYEYMSLEDVNTTKNDDAENKSDTLSEAGTYTLDKEDENTETNTDCFNSKDNEDGGGKPSGKQFQSHWINDWVRDVEEQNMLNLEKKETCAPSKNLENGINSGVTRIPSPIHTINRKAKVRSSKYEDGKLFLAKLNKSESYKHSSSLNAKNNNEIHEMEKSLETESFLRTTESVVTAMQSRMKLSFDEEKKIGKKSFVYKERPHPPSTASDTDTNSETENKTFKKPLGNPFTSARINRAFSLRRARADPDKCQEKKKETKNNVESSSKNCLNKAKSAPSPKDVASKPPFPTPFSRTDCGRFSMKTTISNFKNNICSQDKKKDAKKSNTASRSSSTLSSKEVEFQNWRRRKSFDPMKAAAEGRKKELAKKAAISQIMSQSVNFGSDIGVPSKGTNPVLRSASFHSTVQDFSDEHREPKLFQNQSFSYEPEDSEWKSNHHFMPHNSPTFPSEKFTAVRGSPIFNSRSSLVSETRSPSHRIKLDEVDSLILSAISDLSRKLKIKSLDLLKKFQYLQDLEEEKSFMLANEIAILGTSKNSTHGSPFHRTASKDSLSVTLKNLKELENVFKILDNVLFDEKLSIYFEE